MKTVFFDPRQIIYIYCQIFDKNDSSSRTSREEYKKRQKQPGIYKVKEVIRNYFMTRYFSFFNANFLDFDLL